MFESVIAFTLHKRPFYTSKVLDSWRAVRGVKSWEVRFFIDPSDQREAQRAHCEEFLAWHGNGSVVVNSEPQGVLKAPWHALESCFRRGSSPGASYVVLAEEDVEVADDVLEYMREALPESDIACAWSDEDGPDDEIVKRKWFNPWCWGTNYVVWDEVLRDTWDKDYSTADDSGPGGWDCNIGLRLVNDPGLDIAFPRASRSQHIGQWLGTHQDPAVFGQVEMPGSFRSHRESVQWRFAEAGVVEQV